MTASYDPDPSPAVCNTPPQTPLPPITINMVLERLQTLHNLSDGCPHPFGLPSWSQVQAIGNGQQGKHGE